LETGIAKRERGAAIDTHGAAHKKAGSPTPGARFSHTMRNATACTIERKRRNPETQRKIKEPPRGLRVGTLNGR
jgi:hypothetical protein